MKKLFQNAKQEPRIFYAKHIAPGVCGYENETVFLSEDALRKMDKTFAGKPIYVNHQKVNLDNLQEEADGYVIESFYLPEDGAHWTKNIVVSDKGHEAIGKGWAVSNAYIPDAFGAGGEWHNVPYDREITDAHYTHLAIVENPRYEEATIMTPEEFKTYKESKREQLKQLENSKTKKGEKRMNWKLFEKKEVTNSEDIANKMVELSNGSTVSIAEMINAVEEDLKAKEEKKDKCNEDILEKVVKVNGEDMKVSDLVAKFEKADKKNKCNEDEEDKEKKDADDKDEDKKEDKKASKKNESEEDKEKKDSEEDKEKEDKKNEDVDKRELIRKIMAMAGEAGMSEEKVRTIAKWAEELGYDKDLAQKESKKNSKELLEAEEKANAKKFQGQVVDTMSRKLARGQERYGAK